MSYNCALQTMVFGSSVLDALSSCPVILVISIVLRKKYVNVSINAILSKFMIDKCTCPICKKIK